MMTTRSWGDVVAPCFTPFNNTYYQHHHQNESSDWHQNSQQKSSGIWTQEQNKRFEDALAQFDKDTPDRWERVASLVPGKSPREVADHYRNLEEDVCQIEAGHILCPGYGSSPTMFDWDIDNYGLEELSQSYCLPVRQSGCRASDQELRKKGIPWTEEEHRLFLLGLKKYGKGDWRNISRNFVITRTPTQVASHAQKYFLRLKSGGKDKRRSSIHDITTANLPDNQQLSPSQTSPVSSTSALAPAQSTLSAQLPSMGSDSDGSSAQGNHQFMQQPLGMAQYVMKFPSQSAQNLMVPNNNVLF